MLLVTIIACLASYVLGFKYAEYIYKCDDALTDQDEDELFENKD